MLNWTPELNTFGSGRPVQFSAHVTMICRKETRLTPWDPKGYRNYNQGEFSQIELIWCSAEKGSSALHHFQADLCSRNQVTTTKKLLMHECHTCRQRFKLLRVCSQSTAATLSPGKEPHSAGSYDSIFGFSAHPLAHLWGPRGSLASSSPLISTCQPASCCVWIQGMSGATSRSHSKWQDESEGQGLAYGSD